MTTTRTVYLKSGMAPVTLLDVYSNGECATVQGDDYAINCFTHELCNEDGSPLEIQPSTDDTAFGMDASDGDAGTADLLAPTVTIHEAPIELAIPNRQPAITIHRPVKTGPSFRELLLAAGIEAANVTKNRTTGDFTVKFVDPAMSDFRSLGTDPARVWAERIAAVFPNVKIVETFDSISTIRPVHPVIFATVICRMNAKSA